MTVHKASGPSPAVLVTAVSHLEGIDVALAMVGAQSVKDLDPSFVRLPARLQAAAPAVPAASDERG